ncbi:N-acetylmuramoyl-L-alanine amidase family protein [Zunongwangia atlantica]|uniref:N-acetylmuramoyl-L-alanine amidase n=1 Tax=Zunongwangia atlantica 22II14-10F7 TaxID=1185767 RepID=A0A1Y1T5Y1_9FLAO|nr:N-acetylmuramoyl-L-alanine amidase [Zunongwangia atlantica]ORL46446.1 N-acetylmuramoyl-L-alanine amidase [Zunongwangia atlantica 22II14-10F7]
MRTNVLHLLVLSFFLVCNQQFFAAEKPMPTDPFVVVLDAGHGGKDPGNMGNGYKEKDIALSIVLKVGKELESRGIKVVYTRSTDVFIPLMERGQIANDAEADLFVSVHCNSHSSQASGTETFVLGLNRNETNFEVAKRENSVIYMEEDYKVTYNGFDPNSPESFIGMTLMQEEYLNQSILLADLIQKKFTNDLQRKNRGVKEGALIVLHQTYMPSVLVEVGFLTNNSEGAFLNSGSGQNKMASAIVDGILGYGEQINLSAIESISQSQPKVPTSESGVSIDGQPADYYEGIIFSVQLAAGSKKLDTKSYNFKGLSNVFRKKEGKLYKYYLGETSSYLDIQKIHQKAVSKGYPNSYIVAFKNGEKITVNEALKTNLN